jgi:beta-N-acetylhexosaminidase
MSFSSGRYETSIEVKQNMNITTFSNEQLAGQRLMVGFDGTKFNRELRYLIDGFKVGGIILFAGNLIAPDQINQLCLSVQEYAAASGQPSLFIAIDQEGGQVARLKEPFTQFPGNPAIKDQEDARHFAEVTAAELSRTGINMNLAPVLDVAFNAEKSIMAGRSFGADPVWVADLGSTVIEHLQQSKIMAVAKHFPGIGRTTLDSHVEMPTLDIDFETLTATDLLPFEAAIKREVSGIMLSHILYSQIDSQWPASLSAIITRSVLRDQMGFNGVVLTDDLDMGAITKRYDIKTAVSRILAADIDIALICHQGPDIENAFKTILSAHESSPKIKAAGQESAKRILRLKERFLS